MSLTGFNRARRLAALRENPKAETVEISSGEYGVTDDLREEVGLRPVEPAAESGAEGLASEENAGEGEFRAAELEEITREEIRDLAWERFGVTVPMTTKSVMIERFLEEQRSAATDAG